WSLANDPERPFAPRRLRRRLGESRRSDHHRALRDRASQTLCRDRGAAAVERGPDLHGGLDGIPLSRARGSQLHDTEQDRPSAVSDGTLMLKYTPRTGAWSETNLCQVTLTPA